MSTAELRKWNRLQIGTMILCSGQILLELIEDIQRGLFWDMEGYNRPVADLANHLNPYRSDVKHSFVYHPLVLDVFCWMEKINLNFILFSFYLCSVLFFIRSLAQQTNHWLEIFQAFAFAGLGVLSISTGNLTPYLHFILISAFLRQSRDKCFTYSYTLVFLTALVKPYLLAYILLPIFVEKAVSKKTLFLILTHSLVFGALLFAYQWVNPGPVHDFLESVRFQTLERHDFGVSLLNWSYLVTRNVAFSTGLQLLCSGCLMIYFFYRRLRGAFDGFSRLEATLLGYFLLTIINPRMKEYDLFPALICLAVFGRNIWREKYPKYVAIAFALISIPMALTVLVKVMR